MKVLRSSYLLAPFLLTVSISLLVISRKCSAFAGLLNTTVSSTVRLLLGAISSAFPFSIFELFFASVPLLLISALIYIFYASELREINRRFVRLLLVVVVSFSLFTVTLGVAYSAPPLTASVIDTDTVCDSETVLRTAELLCSEANALKESAAELDYGDIRKHLSDSYSNLLEIKGVRPAYLPVPKKLLMSSLFERMGILAFYSFMSGEVNVNANIPTCSTAFTLAHEYAHFFGASGEWDANFMAFAACISSESDSIKYSGYITAIQYFLPQIKQNDTEMYTKVCKMLNDEVKKDVFDYSSFARAQDSAVFVAADTLNSIHLDIWDKKGKSSYSSFIELVSVYTATISKQSHTT